MRPKKKISNLLDEMDSSGNVYSSDYHVLDARTLSCSLMEFQPVTPETVRTVIMSSRTKSCTLDPVPTVLLKKSIDCLADSITSIISMSLTRGLFLSRLKHGLVFPVIKKQNDDPDLLKNYRPITNLLF